MRPTRQIGHRAQLLVIACVVFATTAAAVDANASTRVLEPVRVQDGAVRFSLTGMTPQRLGVAKAVCPHVRAKRLSRRRVVAGMRRGHIHLHPKVCRARTSLRGGWRLVLTHRAARPAPAARPSRVPPPVIFRDEFNGPDKIITNHYARWTDDARAARSPNWAMDSGSMFRHDGTAWTGSPTCNLPNRTSSNGSGSAIFRAHLTRDDLPPSYRVSFDLRNNGFTQGCPDRPAEGWNGVKAYLRRVDGETFYTAEVSLRDGKAYIQKKIGGEYHILAQEAGHRARIGEWEKVGGVVRTNPNGSVTVQVLRAGRPILEATDRGVGGPPITAAGQTGFRGDNTDFAIDDFTVAALSR